MPTKKTKSDYEKMHEKASKIGMAYCRVCGRDLYAYDKGIAYTTTHRATICLFHLDCAIKEARRGTHTLRFTEVAFR